MSIVVAVFVGEFEYIFVEVGLVDFAFVMLGVDVLSVGSVTSR